MELNLKRVAEFIRGAETEDLLNRVTVFRDTMEPAALDLMEGELDRRGVTRDQIAEHDAKFRECVILNPDGTAMHCSFCERPAVIRQRGWHRVWGRIPLFPRMLCYCETHQKPAAQ